MRIVFTRNRLPLSWLIRKITGEPVSHVAFIFDDKWVIESNFKGVGIKWLNAYQKHQSIVHEIRYDLPLEKEEEAYVALLNATYGKKYDLGLLVFDLLAFGLNRAFGVKLPGRNWFASRNKYACFELYADLAVALPEWLSPIEEGQFSMMTPDQLRLVLQGRAIERP